MKMTIRSNATFEMLLKADPVQVQELLSDAISAFCRERAPSQDYVDTRYPKGNYPDAWREEKKEQVKKRFLLGQKLHLLCVSGEVKIERESSDLCDGCNDVGWVETTEDRIERCDQCNKFSDAAAALQHFYEDQVAPYVAKLGKLELAMQLLDPGLEDSFKRQIQQVKTEMDRNMRLATNTSSHLFRARRL